MKFELKISVISNLTNTLLFYERTFFDLQAIQNSVRIVLPIDFQDLICTEHKNYKLNLRLRLVEFPGCPDQRFSNDYEGDLFFDSTITKLKAVLTSSYKDKMNVSVAFVGTSPYEFPLVVPRMMVSPPNIKYRVFFTCFPDIIEVGFAKWDFQCPLCHDDHDKWEEMIHHFKDHTFFEALLQKGNVGDLDEIHLLQTGRKVINTAHN